MGAQRAGGVQPLQVDVVSDVMCPWCYIGKRRLEAAAALSATPLDIRWRPFQLDPTLPPEGVDRAAYLAEKFGSSDKARERTRAVEAAGEAEGIAFAFERIAVSPNTLDAHRVIRWAASAGENRQDGVVEALFRAYFVEGRNVGDHAVLVEVAAEAGMDASLVRRLLATDADRDLVRREVELAQQMGVTGVPTFVVAQRYAVVGAQSADTLAEAFAAVAAQRSVNDNSPAG